MQRCFKANILAIRVSLNHLEATTTFPYLGRMVTYNNSDWVNLYINLRKSQSRLGMVVKVMGTTGAPIKAWEMMYKVVVQALLLYVSEIWVGIDTMMAVL